MTEREMGSRHLEERAGAEPDPLDSAHEGAGNSSTPPPVEEPVGRPESRAPWPIRQDRLPEGDGASTPGEDARQGSRAPSAGGDGASPTSPRQTDAASQQRDAASRADADPQPIAATPRVRGFAVPPPDPAETLYYEGMAAYQHRNWQEASDCFSELKELQPGRPGLDALLDEVRWFLQLEAAVPQPVNPAPSAGQTVTPAAARRPGGTAAGAASPAGVHPRGGEGASRRAFREMRGVAPRGLRWQTWGLIAIAVIGLAASALIVLQQSSAPLGRSSLGGYLPWSGGAAREAQELYNRGQERLAVGDYEGAQAAFEKLLALSPADPEAQLGLNRAQRQQALAQGYAAAEAAIAEENWDLAAAELEKTLSIDSGYADAQAKADFVAQRKRLADLYSDGSRLYDLGQWEQAIAQFEKIRELDNTYRAEAVAEFLFASYLSAGEALIEQADGTAMVPIRQAIEYFTRALAVHPRSRPAADARRLAILYLEAVQALANGEPDGGESRLDVLLTEAPTYANGLAAARLYELLIKRAEAALKAGDVPSAIRDYQKAQTVAVSDHGTALEGEAYARAITPTPTPRPTLTPRPTAIPVAPTPYAVVRTGPVNVRAGPGEAYPVIGQVRSGDSLAVTGRSADGAWLLTCCVSRQPGWIASGLIEFPPKDFDGTVGDLAVAAPPPLPQRSPMPLTRQSSTPSAEQVICLQGQVRDTSGGTPLAGWSIVLEISGVTQTQRTDQNGFYRFSNLPAGTYTVREQTEAGWQAVSPQVQAVTVALAATCSVVDFWNERATGDAAPAPPR